LTDCGRGAEALADAYARAADTLDGLLDDHAGQSLLVVGHPAVNRTYLAGQMGLPPSQSRRVPLDPCGISVVVRVGGRTGIATLNAAFHLQGVAA
jgi:broad specificity phosphatase PhoE